MKIYLYGTIWHYDNDFRYIDSSRPDHLFWDTIFQSRPEKAAILRHCQEQKFPLVFGDDTELLWIAAPLHDRNIPSAGSLSDIYVLGPVYLSAQSEGKIKQALKRHMISLVLQQELIRHLKQLPSISAATFLCFGTMLHYCLTSERINISDIRVYTSASESLMQVSNSDKAIRKIHSGAAFEALLVSLIEKGNLNYQAILDNASLNYGQIGTLARGDSIRQLKNQTIAAAVIYSRAAIRGGLPRETALTLADQYIQTVENTVMIPELIELFNHMIGDFIRHVHDCRQHPNISTTIRTCMDLIECHIMEPLSIAWIAGQMNYSAYYLSERFKKETGTSIGDYIKEKKIELAKALLLDMEKSIRDIAEDLSFSTPSRFTATFHKITGMTPGEYREQNG